MLAFLFRGAFFLGVVGWYSLHLWGMIDGYFKEQFKRYLEEEFERNPVMRKDVVAHAAVDKAGSGFPEECHGGFCAPAGAADAFPAGALAEGEGRSAEKEVARPAAVAGEPAFHGSADDRPPGETPRSIDAVTGNQESSTFEIATSKENEPKKILEEKDKQSVHTQQKESQQQRQKSETRTRSKSWLRRRNLPKEDFTNRKARGVPTLIHPRGDFKESKKPRFSQHFFELDDVYGDKKEEELGISISELPYRPAIEIYDLERLPADEFCPLTLEEDLDCEESHPWSYESLDTKFESSDSVLHSDRMR